MDDLTVRPIVSVIIPVYNVEEYLDECIVSVINQTYSNLEIILIDDGSTDSSGDICEKYAGFDSRILVVHEENHGLGAARNTGIQLCHGDFFVLLDSDDMIADDLISTYLKIALRFGVSFVRGGLQRFNNIEELLIKRKKHRVYRLNDEQMIEKILVDIKLISACGALVKSEMAGIMHFPEGVLYEDIGTMLNTIHACELIAFCEDDRYYYRKRSNSITSENITKEHCVFLDYVDLYTKKIVDWHPRLLDLSIKYRVNAYLDMYFRILSTGLKLFPNEQKRIKSVLRRDFIPFMFCCNNRFRDKFKLALSFFSKRLYVNSRKIWTRGVELLKGTH